MAPDSILKRRISVTIVSLDGCREIGDKGLPEVNRKQIRDEMSGTGYAST